MENRYTMTFVIDQMGQSLLLQTYTGLEIPFKVTLGKVQGKIIKI